MNVITVSPKSMVLLQEKTAVTINTLRPCNQWSFLSPYMVNFSLRIKSAFSRDSKYVLYIHNEYYYHE